MDDLHTLLKLGQLRLDQVDRYREPDPGIAIDVGATGGDLIDDPDYAPFRV